MNIQLFLEGQEVELTDSIVFPLNKSYENLYNPTDIIVEYSKSVNIPMTQRNNQLMGGLYNISRTIAAGGTGNIGLYLDPNKRIPFRLLYNGKLVMEGYAKFSSATCSTSNKFYTLNLYGALGDVLHKLKEVVLDESQLAEGESTDYVLNDHCEGMLMDQYFQYVNWNFDSYDMDINEASDYEILGLAPSYHGYNTNFKSDQCEIVNGTTHSIIPIADYLKDKWKDNYALYRYGDHYDDLTNAQKATVNAYIDAIDIDEVVGDGFKDFQMRDYRSYQQRPYVYFNKLMQMYQEKCQQLTGYTIKLDENWFAASNPYWTRSCYMLDFLDTKGGENNGTIPMGSWSATQKKTFANSSSGVDSSFAPGQKGQSSAFHPAISPANVQNMPLISSKVTVNSNKVHIHLEEVGVFYSEIIQRVLATGASPFKPEFLLSSHTKFVFTWSAQRYGDSTHVGPTMCYWTAENAKDNIDSNYTKDKYLPMTISKGGSVKVTNSSTHEITIRCWADIDVELPIFTFEGDFSYVDSTHGGIYTNFATHIANASENYIGMLYMKSPISQAPPITVNHTINPNYDYITFTVPEAQTNYRGLVQARLKNLYKKETPLFNVILEYTKMFGLLWDIDYEDKTINIVPRSKYFSDYTVQNWDSKLDKSKDYVIEPVVFPSKYIEFNYEHFDGYRYSDYKDKYGIEYGSKKIKTNFDFNTDNDKLFSGVRTSMSSNRTFVSFKQLCNWNTVTPLRGQVDPFETMECANAEDTSPVNVNNWYLRGENHYLTDPVIISDDSATMINEDAPCYYVYGTDDNREYYLFPVFSPIYQDTYIDTGKIYGMLFNQPSEDYTKDKRYDAAGSNYIYNKYWNNYINERYNAQNKKLTAYFRLDNSDYFDWKFDRFVVLQDQLFCVNKIYDYNINSHDTTKVELIQISDPVAYANTNELFDPIQVTPEQIIRDNCNNGGTFEVDIRTNGEPTVTIAQTGGSSVPNVFIEDREIIGYGWESYAITWEDLAGAEWTGTITITAGPNNEFTREIPVILRSSTYSG